jgi:hypothetical protein
VQLVACAVGVIQHKAAVCVEQLVLTRQQERALTPKGTPRASSAQLFTTSRQSFTASRQLFTESRQLFTESGTQRASSAWL